MDRRKWFRRMELFGGKHPCVYCGAPADTSDHTPPKCLLPRKLPNDVQAMTIPACIDCNHGFHIDEIRVAAVVHVVSFTDADRAAMKDGGWVHSAIHGDRVLEAFIANRMDEAGVFHPDHEVFDAFRRIMTKTTTGLLFHEFGRIVRPEEITMLGVEHTHSIPASAFVELHRAVSSGYPEVTPSVRQLERQVLAMYGQETPTMPKWSIYLKGYFEYILMRREDSRMLVGLLLHDALTIALDVPWPGTAGPRRNGKPRLC